MNKNKKYCTIVITSDTDRQSFSKKSGKQVQNRRHL